MTEGVNRAFDVRTIGRGRGENDARRAQRQQSIAVVNDAELIDQHSAEARGDQYPPLFPEAAARIAVAVKFLQDKGYKKIAIVSHSFGSRMTNVLLNQPDAPAIAAWVSIGITGEYTHPATLKAPVLDLYGEKDFPEVLELAAKRAAVIRNIHGSAQIRVAGADHFFNGMDNELVRNVKLFLDRATR